MSSDETQHREIHMADGGHYHPLRMEVYIRARQETSITETYALHLVDKAQNLPTDVLSPGLFVVHDTGGGSEDDLAE